MDVAAKRFFQAPYFAVAGASNDPSKYGNIVLAWYTAHSLPVTPLNPWTPSISLLHTPARASPSQPAPRPSRITVPTLPTPLDLPHASQTSLSVITPPRITSVVLAEAQLAGVKAVWLQPGSFDDEVMAFAKGAFECVVGGRGDGVGGGEGWCVLVHGEEAMEGRPERRESL